MKEVKGRRQAGMERVTLGESRTRETNSTTNPGDRAQDCDYLTCGTDFDLLSQGLQLLFL